jgi:putrescine transport system ATP-binding protein
MAVQQSATPESTKLHKQAQAFMGQNEADSQYIRIENVTKKFDDFVAVDAVDLTIRKGEVFALLGSSGCGKSTLLRVLAGFESPTNGRVFIDGQDMAGIRPHLRPTNMMFQSYALFPHMTVEKNIAYGLRQEGASNDEVATRVTELLELVHMIPRARYKPHQLSGGQQQRVALARSLAKHPKLLLLDEPMSALDKKLRMDMQLEVANILDRVGVTCVMVTHDQEEAMTMAHRIGVMSEGRLLQVGTPSNVYEQPNCRFAADFIGEVNIFSGHVCVDESDHVIVETPEMECKLFIDHGISGTLGMPVWVAVRPEKIRVLQHKPEGCEYNCAKGRIHEIAYFGSRTIYHVMMPGGKKIIASTANVDRSLENRPTWDSDVYVSWQADSSVVLTA